MVFMISESTITNEANAEKIVTRGEICTLGPETGLEFDFVDGGGTRVVVGKEFTKITE